MNLQVQQTHPSDFESPKVLRNTALAFAFAALTLTVAAALKHHFGYLNLRALLALPSHSQAFLEFVAEGFGASLLLPAIHIAVASCFKSHRNSRTRWKILLGWSLVAALLAVLRLLS